MRVLGISAFYHDSAAALVEDGRIVAAAQEERFTRKKHDPSFPRNAIAYCIDEAKSQFDDLDYVVFYDKPFLKFERLMETYIALAPRGFRCGCAKNCFRRVCSGVNFVNFLMASMERSCCSVSIT